MDAAVQDIDQFCREMEDCHFFQKILESLKSKIHSIVCYGIGCVHESNVSQYQYACVLRLHSLLNIQKPIEVFDPAIDMVALLGICES